MRLSDALKTLQKADAALPPFEAFLACGFTPLHLQTFLTAWMQQQLPRNHAKVSIGIFGDLAGNIARISEGSASVGVVLLEWQDLDPRLGIRRVSGWEWKDLAAIASDVRQALARLERLIETASARVPLVVSFPTLPFPSLSSQHPDTISPVQADLELALAEMRVRLLQHPSITILNSPEPSEQAFDPTGELSSGFPYSLAHASGLARRIAAAACPAPIKKGLITDLDMTLWKGIVGDDGANGIHWDLEHHAPSHGLYQQLLHALAKEGVLIAAASKNSPEVVEQIFATRDDLILKEEDIFPLAASWQPKSELVGSILKTWNIAADSVVFVDDNPFELEEVGRMFPGMECIQFDPSPRSVLALWRELRIKFARQTISEEDRIRSASIRAAAESNPQAAGSADMESFLERLEAKLQFDFSRNAADTRALELINKTNQFNLNGIRRTDAEFRSYLAREGSFLLTTTYTDKFGPLGKISSLLGRVAGDEIVVDSWVLSCRAFSRRIEFSCLRALLDFCPAKRIQVHYKKTDRNGPLQEFLSALAGSIRNDALIVDRERFLEACPVLPHSTKSNIAEELDLKVWS